MWLQKSAQVVLVPEWMPDTITRCLADGWAEVPDPRPVVPASGTDADAQPPEADPATRYIEISVAGETIVQAVEHAEAEPEPIPIARRRGRR